MVALIIGMLVCLALAVAVVAVVAIPARRQGRVLLTPQGEDIVALVREKTEATLEKTGDTLSSAKDKMGDSVSQLGPRGGEEVGRHRAS